MSNQIGKVLYIRSANNSLPSLEFQRNVGEMYAEEHSLDLSIIEDSHLSGLTPLIERPGLGWLIQLVENGLIKKVLVDSAYRISRDSVVICSFVDLLKKHNAKLIVINSGDKLEK